MYGLTNLRIQSGDVRNALYRNNGSLVGSCGMTELKKIYSRNLYTDQARGVRVYIFISEQLFYSGIAVLKTNRFAFVH